MGNVFDGNEFLFWMTGIIGEYWYVVYDDGDFGFDVECEFVFFVNLWFIV